MDKFISGTTVKKQFDIATVTLNRWADDGKVQFVKGPGGRRLYSQSGIYKLFDLEFPKEPISNTEAPSRTNVCYCRVSSAHQSEDLQRQIEYLSKEYPDYEIISDIGSGLNWKRKGFNSLLERVYKHEIGTVVVAYKDRLCRFGSEIVEFIFKKAGTKFVVHSKGEEEPNESKELSDDLISVVTCFVARANGRRSGINRRKRKEQKIADERKDGGNTSDSEGEITFED